ncbi:hypothetical protein MLD38_001726 [Melastoma candidum]|uniref:Uncharacterized protein n=1 Tax=Melastoma candidum TaxID=119954 RepID=A0ACB9SDG6_9MYRT|nr:hypothetical protein MLD38_001726 [Melastoma candidum]
MTSALLLILSSSIRDRYSAEGRVFEGLDRSNPKGAEDGEGAREAVGQSVIGWSPPRCERRCRSCARCSAVQVPVARQVWGRSSRDVAYCARGDDLSNYKPMTWKCKCGDHLFNP